LNLHPTDKKSGETCTYVINSRDNNNNNNNNNNKFKIASNKRDATVMGSFRLTFTQDV